MQRMTILILDELDQACKTTEEAVQKIFSLSTTSSSRLVVIGIANRLDLAHRVLQPLGAASGRASPVPTIISFHSYTARQLLQLLQVWTDLTLRTLALQPVAAPQVLPCTFSMYVAATMICHPGWLLSCVLSAVNAAASCNRTR